MIKLISIVSTLLLVLSMLLLLTVASTSAQPGTVVPITFTSPNLDAVYPTCTCVSVVWNSLEGTGDFSESSRQKTADFLRTTDTTISSTAMHFDMWRQGTTYAPIDVRIITEARDTL
jgi:hypothetical protein